MVYSKSQVRNELLALAMLAILSNRTLIVPNVLIGA